MLMPGNAPCRGCERRQLGCHSSCGEYLDWRKQRDEQLSQNYKEKESRRMTTAWILRNTKRKERWR